MWGVLRSKDVHEYCLPDFENTFDIFIKNIPTNLANGGKTRHDHLLFLAMEVYVGLRRSGTGNNSQAMKCQHCQDTERRKGERNRGKENKTAKERENKKIDTNRHYKTRTFISRFHVSADYVCQMLRVHRQRLFCSWVPEFLSIFPASLFKDASIIMVQW